MTPKISIIVPAYNAEAYISECVGHLLRLDYPDYEVIVVNDGSTDGTAELLTAFGERIRVVDRPNGGPSAARNTGLRAAEGEYILFCDADDYYYSDALSVLMPAMSHDVDIVAGESSSNEREPTAGNTGPAVIVTGREMALNCLYQKKGFNNSPWGKLYRRSLFDSSCLYKEGTWYEDLEISMRLFSKARKVVLLKDQVYFYRQHPYSFLHRWSEGRLDSLTVTESLVKEAAGYGAEMERAARSRRYSAAWNLLFPAWRHGYKDVARQCLQIIRQSRGEALADSNVRVKNKLAALGAYLVGWLWK